MSGAGGDSGDSGACGQADGHRCSAVGTGPVAQLTKGIVAPGNCGAAGGNRQTVGVASGEGGNRGTPRQTDSHRRTAIGRRPITQLTRRIATPGKDITRGRQRQTEGDTSGDRRSRGTDSHRRTAIGGRPITQLTRRIATPGKDITRGRQRQTVGVASGDRGHRDTRRQTDSHRRTAIGGRPITQLTRRIATPGKDITRGRQRQTVGGPSGDCGSRDTRRQTDNHRRRAVDGCPITQLTDCIVAPGEDCARGRQRQTEGSTSGDRGHRDTRRQTDSHRRTAIGRRPITQLTRRIATPGKDITRGRQRQVVGRTSGDRGHRDTRRQTDSDRHAAVSSGPVTQLTGGIVTPGKGGVRRDSRRRRPVLCDRGRHANRLGDCHGHREGEPTPGGLPCPTRPGTTACPLADSSHRSTPPSE